MKIAVLLIVFFLLLIGYTIAFAIGFSDANDMATVPITWGVLGLVLLGIATFIIRGMLAQINKMIEQNNEMVIKRIDKIETDVATCNSSISQCQSDISGVKGQLDTIIKLEAHR